MKYLWTLLYFIRRVERRKFKTCGDSEEVLWLQICCLCPTKAASKWRDSGHKLWHCGPGVRCQHTLVTGDMSSCHHTRARADTDIITASNDLANGLLIAGSPESGPESVPDHRGWHGLVPQPPRPALAQAWQQPPGPASASVWPPRRPPRSQPPQQQVALRLRPDRLPKLSCQQISAVRGKINSV